MPLWKLFEKWSDCYLFHCESINCGETVESDVYGRENKNDRAGKEMGRRGWKGNWLRKKRKSGEGEKD